ncbi:MAG: amidohydrolase [Clostridiales Family XIII bacterium]|jgi:5-methylthioadenosine/S-adenosylhomocysteine deaminase|nr:amidohydrolase [Clostridiales Family XIII bacterium]
MLNFDKKEEKLILKNATILFGLDSALTSEDVSIKQADIYILNSEIYRLAVRGSATEVNGSASLPEFADVRTIDMTGKLVLPGFFNIHAHSPMTLMRGYGGGLNLQDWLNKKIFPFEDKLDSHAVYHGTLLAIAESLKNGIVSTSDMYYFCEDMVRAFAESGAKANIARGITCFSDEDTYSLASFKEAKSLYEQYNHYAEGRILVDMSAHAEYTTTPRLIRELSDYTKSVRTRMHIHVSETKTEHEECKARRDGLTPVQYLDSLGCFDRPAIVAHGVWLEDADMEILAKRGATVAHCPKSNMKLASGICDISSLMKKGVRVGIGTDSVSSNNNLDYLEEMKTMALLAKLKSLDPTAVSPLDALQAATKTGAHAQGRLDSGVLNIEHKADLIAIDLEDVSMSPVHDLLSNVVYSASNSLITMTMCDGKILYKDGEYLTLDIEKIKYEANVAIKRIQSEL